MPCIREAGSIPVFIHVPTLAVAANRDPVCKPEAGDRISQDVPIIPAKHMGFMEHDTQFAALVEDFAEACFHALQMGEKA